MIKCFFFTGSSFSNKFFSLFVLFLFILSFYPSTVVLAFNRSSSSLSYTSAYFSSSTDYSSPSSSFNLSFSSYLGGSSYDLGESIAVDTAGNSYITGFTASSDFPTKNAFNATNSGMDDVFVAKFNSSGNLVFSTYMGGNNSDFGNAIAVDSFGDCYITGITSSSNFPTKSAFNATYGGNSDVFLAKFGPLGQLLFSTYLGGAAYEYGTGIALNSFGDIFVTGGTYSSNFPVLNSVNSSNNNGVENAFVSEFNSTGSLLYSTTFGGFGDDFGASLAVDHSGNYFITGSTSSSNFPTKHAFDATYGGTGDVFVTKFNATHALVFSTFLGGNESDEASSIAVDSSGNCILTGQTRSSNFPGQFASYNATFSFSTGIGFITKFNSNGSLLFSLFIDPSNSIAVSSSNDYFVAGSDSIFQFDSSGIILSHSIFNNIFGISTANGIALDPSGAIYLVGTTNSNITIKNAFQSVYGGGFNDAFLSKFTLVPITSNSTNSTAPTSASLTNTVTTVTVSSITTVSFHSSFLNSFLNSILLIFSFIIVLGLILLGSYIVIEYKKYSKIKKQNVHKNGHSFRNYLISSFTRFHNKNDSINLLSDDTFELLESIEEENKTN